MGTVSLGKIAFTWRGAYDASATYARQDVVGHHGDSFVCLADATTGVAPHANSRAWDLFAQGTQGVSNLPGEVIYFDGCFSEVQMDRVKRYAHTSFHVLILSTVLLLALACCLERNAQLGSAKRLNVNYFAHLKSCRAPMHEPRGGSSGGIIFH